MIALNISVLWQILLFLGLWLIVSKVLFRPYMTVLEQREQKTTGADDSSEHLEQQAERLRAQYEETIVNAAAAGNASKNAIVQQARQQREALLTSAREEAAGILERVRQEVQSQLAQEHELAVREADAVAQDMVSKILGRRVG
ncbi:MAG TPA: ATP synthase F0 subunit B [Candidatus Binatia bacterium]